MSRKLSLTTEANGHDTALHLNVEALRLEVLGDQPTRAICRGVRPASLLMIVGCAGITFCSDCTVLKSMLTCSNASVFFYHRFTFQRLCHPWRNVDVLCHRNSYPVLRLGTGVSELVCTVYFQIKRYRHYYTCNTSIRD